MESANISIVRGLKTRMDKIMRQALKEKQEWIKKYRCGYGFCKNTANPANNGSGIPICDDCYHNGNYDGIEYYGVGN